MTAIIKWNNPQIDYVGLTDYGHEEDKNWDDLNEDEQSEILDFIRSEFILTVREIRTVE